MSFLKTQSLDLLGRICNAYCKDMPMWWFHSVSSLHWVVHALRALMAWDWTKALWWCLKSTLWGGRWGKAQGNRCCFFQVCLFWDLKILRWLDGFLGVGVDSFLWFMVDGFELIALQLAFDSFIDDLIGFKRILWVYIKRTDGFVGLYRLIAIDSKSCSGKPLPSETLRHGVTSSFDNG